MWLSSQCVCNLEIWTGTLRQMDRKKTERVNQTGMVQRKEDRCYKNTLAHMCAAYMYSAVQHSLVNKCAVNLRKSTSFPASLQVMSQLCISSISVMSKHITQVIKYILRMF